MELYIYCMLHFIFSNRHYIENTSSSVYRLLRSSETVGVSGETSGISSSRAFLRLDEKIGRVPGKHLNVWSRLWRWCRQETKGAACPAWLGVEIKCVLTEALRPTSLRYDDELRG